MKNELLESSETAQARRDAELGKPRDDQALREAAEERERAWRNALAAVLATYEGRAVIGEIVFSGRFAGVLGKTAVGSDGVHETFRLEGRREIGLDLWAEIQRVVPDACAAVINQRQRKATP